MASLLGSAVTVLTTPPAGPIQNLLPAESSTLVLGSHLPGSLRKREGGPDSRVLLKLVGELETAAVAAGMGSGAPDANMEAIEATSSRKPAEHSSLLSHRHQSASDVPTVECIPRRE